MNQVSDMSTHGPVSGAVQQPSSSSIQNLARFPRLVERGEGEIEVSLHRLAELLSSFDGSGSINFHYVAADRTYAWQVLLEPNRARVAQGAAEGAALELIIRPSTWLEIASGSLSPLLAFGSGRMRIRGDINLAKSLLRHVATSPQAVVEIC